MGEEEESSDLWGRYRKTSIEFEEKVSKTGG